MYTKLIKLHIFPTNIEALLSKPTGIAGKFTVGMVLACMYLHSENYLFVK
jgi:hypothetical protein